MPKEYRDCIYLSEEEVEQRLGFYPGDIEDLCSKRVFYYRGMAESSTASSDLSPNVVFVDGLFFSEMSDEEWGCLAPENDYGPHFTSSLAVPCLALVNDNLVAATDLSAGLTNTFTLKLKGEIKGPVCYTEESVKAVQAGLGIPTSPSLQAEKLTSTKRVPNWPLITGALLDLLVESKGLKLAAVVTELADKKIHGLGERTLQGAFAEARRVFDDQSKK